MRWMKELKMRDDILDPLAVPLRETVRLLGSNRTWVYKLIGDGVLDARKQGRRTLVTVERIRAYAAGLPKARIGGGLPAGRILGNAPVALL